MKFRFPPLGIPSLKIREKIFLGVGTYIFLAAIIGVFAYRELYIITSKLPIFEKLDDITHNIVEARTAEKNFLLYRQEEDIKAFRKCLDLIKSDSNSVRPEISGGAGAEDFRKMLNSLAAYEHMFDELAGILYKQDETERLLSSARTDIEQKLSGGELHSFLIAASLEKNFIINRDKKDFDNFMAAVDAMKSVNALKKRYSDEAASLFSLYSDEVNAEESMRVKAREAQFHAENLFHRERSEIPATMKRTMKLLLFAMLTIVVVGAIVNTRLAMSIAVPLKKLEMKTKEIAMGDFSESIEVKGTDEIASLAKSFNQMEDHLKLAVSSLEHTITRLQEQQAQLVEAEKLASMGILTAGIAHEINNPLTSVLSFSKLMLEQTPESDPNYARLKIMVRDAQRARTIVRELLSFARETPIRPVTINVNQPVSEIIESLIAQDAFMDIELKVNLSSDLPDILADPVRIGQVTLNMLLNAIHAITPPGRIGVETRLAGNVVEIVFSDTGQGIPEKHLNRIFDPFFTTKGARKGTGLGLAISYGIIQNHGGDIKVESAEGKGSTFTVRLPSNG
ncbi:MAG TPA: ATP-binding protein [Dissulfurispiraceae bacterium]|nr:ATP-binding protein [Dissulfurispiraceae bacterium]